jgi:anti-anti-sigma factor
VTVSDTAGDVAGPPTLEVAVVPDQGEVTLQLQGALDVSTVTVLDDCLAHLDPTARRIVLDLSRVSFIDSTGVGALVRARRESDVGFRTLSVRNPSDRVRFVLEVAGVADLLI